MPEATEEQPTEAPRKERPLAKNLLRWAKVGGIGLLATLGVFAAGFATGWVSSNNVVLSAPTSTFEPTAAPIVPGFGVSVLMPDVRGLTPDDAQQVLADAGVDLATVELSSRPAAGPSGLVVAQAPAFGAETPDVVSLVISEPATVPTAVGERATSVIAALSKLGAQVQRESVYVPGATIGTITSITPAAGESLPEIVAIQVTAAPATLSLAELSVTGACDTSSSERMDGKDWSNAVVCSSASKVRVGTWNIRGDVVEITGTLGLQDSADSDSEVSVEIVGDGVVLGTYTISRGDSFEFTLSVAGVSQLSVRTISLSGDSPKVVVGNFTALGSSTPIENLASS